MPLESLRGVGEQRLLHYDSDGTEHEGNASARASQDALCICIAIAAERPEQVAGWPEAVLCSKAGRRE